ncbi:hypothetical protein M413DRAFT_21821 [Hebeloma cylindrosporum]|uniref:Uncharacterized protein n=1 Tax=Hebeloma cylindrosporum TaxID=76867 RepID=A0A0C2Z945_HEBCY|nr:hypothetical protein M413DRAFT_21821 [Hebeloma cylindrosporum h7]
MHSSRERARQQDTFRGLGEHFTSPVKKGLGKRKTQGMATNAFDGTRKRQRLHDEIVAILATELPVISKGERVQMGDDAPGERYAASECEDGEIGEEPSGQDSLGATGQDSESEGSDCALNETYPQYDSDSSDAILGNQNQFQKPVANQVAEKEKKAPDRSDGDESLTVVSRGTSSDVHMSDDDPQSSRKTQAVKRNLQAKPTNQFSDATKPSSGNSKRSFDEGIQDSPDTSARRCNVANELFPVSRDEGGRQSKSLPDPSAPPKSVPLATSDSSAQLGHPNATISQPPPHQSYSHYPIPLTNGFLGAPPSIDGYYDAAGYGHPYAPVAPPPLQRNLDNSHANSPMFPPNGLQQQRFGGDHPPWGMPHYQYQYYHYPERHGELPIQYLYRAGHVPYNHSGPGVNPYDRMGAYHASNAYNYPPYGYSSGPHQGQSPSVHPSPGSLPTVGFGSNVPALKDIKHTSAQDGSGSSGTGAEAVS